MSPTRLLTAAAFGIVVLAAGCGSNSEPLAGGLAPAAKSSTAAQPDLPGRIAFRRFLDAAQTHGAVFVADPDGSGEKQLTHPPAGVVDDQPDFSPDGKLIAFERCGVFCSVFTVPVSGGEPTKVPVRCRLKPVCTVDSPSWTPDHKLLVGVAQGRERDHGEMTQIERFSVDKVNLDGTRQRTIVKRTGWTGDTQQPAMSPDGKRLVYMAWNSWRTKPVDGRALYVVNVDGSNNHRVTPWTLEAGDHAGFAPDGSKILFRSHSSEAATKQADFFTVRPNAGGLIRLTHVEDGTLVLSTSYSPDGKYIVHASDGIDGQADIYVMNADGTGNHPITRTKLWDSGPDWGPEA
jgi:TolB protein